MKLSIITINRNNAEGLAETLKSVWGNVGRFSDFEHIVIDGASTDSSVDVADKYRDRLAALVSEPDKGIFDAMNKGASLAKGEYLMFLNSGDTLLPGVLDEIDLGNLTEDVVYGDIDVVDDYGTTRFVSPEPEEILPSFFILRSLPHQATFTRKSLFNSFGGFDVTTKLSGDRKLFFQASLSRETTFRHVKVCIARFDGHGVSSNPKLRFQAAVEISSYLSPVLGQELVERALFGRLFTKKNVLELVKNEPDLVRDLLRMTDLMLAIRRTRIGRWLISTVSKAMERHERKLIEKSQNRQR